MEAVDKQIHAADRSTDWHARSDVWRGRRSDADLPAVSTGYPALDRWLPTHGWPLGSVCEILHEADGDGELSLLLPALTRMASAQRPIVWIVPPYQPHSPALRQQRMTLDGLRMVRSDPGQALWAAEQCLRAGCCAAVLVWPEQATASVLRRLQLAAETGRCHGFVFRSIRHLAQPSPVPLRLSVRRRQDQLQVRFDKCRGLLTPPSGFVDVTTGTDTAEKPLPDDGRIRAITGINASTGSVQLAVPGPVQPRQHVAWVSRIDTKTNPNPADSVQAIPTDLFGATAPTPTRRSGNGVSRATNPDITKVAESLEFRQVAPARDSAS